MTDRRYLALLPEIKEIAFSHFIAHSEPLFYKLNILDIYKLSKYCTCMFVFDLKYSNLPHTVEHYFEIPKHSYPTRLTQVENFRIPSSNLTISQHNIRYAAVKYWNSLPGYLKQLSSRQVFKSALKHHLLNLH